MRIGYSRVSTRDQHPESQHDALTAAGCDEIFLDKASGTLARRPELDEALLSANRTGDQIVITKLDRLGRSLEHLLELSTQLQDRGVDLVVLDQGINTSTALGRMFFQILGSIAELSTRDRRAARSRVPLRHGCGNRSPSPLTAGRAACVCRGLVSRPLSRLRSRSPLRRHGRS